MALRTPLSVTPHLYMGDSTGRPLDMGTVYFGEQDKDPEFYPITLYSDDALTKPLAQPVHTKGGYLYDKGDMVEPHAKELIYSVKVLDSYGRKVFYKGAMMRNSWNDDVIEQINTAIIDSADVARQVATDITNDAINNTAVEGGVLADTFVTVTSNQVGSVPRSLRDVNNDVISLKAFGSPIGNDWTGVFTKAVATGRVIVIPDGDYQLRTDNILLGGKSLRLLSPSGAANIELIKGSAQTVFTVTNSDKVIIEGLAFKNTLSEQLNVLRTDTLGYTEKLEINKCVFNGNVGAYWGSGDKNVDPFITPAGFGLFKYTNNTINNNFKGHISAFNHAVKLAHIEGNTCNDFAGVMLNFGIENTAANMIKLQRYNNAIVKNNTTTNSDANWFDDKGYTGTYFTFFLGEGYSVEYTGNTVSGMKVRTASTSMYDAYLNYNKVKSNGNTYRNNINQGSNRATLFMSKIGRLVGEANYVKNNKDFSGNTFIIERDWLESVGETWTEHEIANVGAVNAGEVAMCNNNFNLIGVDNGRTTAAEKFTYTGNTLVCEDVTSSMLIRVDGVGVNSTGIFSNNSTMIKGDKLTGTCQLFGVTIPKLWGSLTINNNPVTIESNSKRFMLINGALANNASVQGNTVIGGTLFHDMLNCTFNKLEYRNNTLPSGTETRFLQKTSFSGASNLSHTVFAKLSVMYMPIFGNTEITELTGITQYRVTLTVDDISAKWQASFVYSLQKVGQDFIVKFTNTKSEEVVVTNGVSSKTALVDNNILLVSTGDVANELTIRYTESSSNGNAFRAVTVPASAKKISIDITALG